MMQPLTRWEYIRAIVAKWIVINIASRISALAVLALCLEIAEKYMEHIEVDDE
jgi:hypothetical protein